MLVEQARSGRNTEASKEEQNVFSVGWCYMCHRSRKGEKKKNLIKHQALTHKEEAGK